MVACPVLQPRLHHLEFKRQDALEDVHARLHRLDPIEHGKQVCGFCGCLVEEPQTGETGQAEVPELMYRRFNK